MTQELPYKLVPPYLYTSYSWGEKESMKCLTTEQLSTLNNWLTEVNSRAAEKQYLEKKTSGQTRLPYYGAIGGSLTFRISGTSLGAVVKVTEEITGETIDLTDYGSW